MRNKLIIQSAIGFCMLFLLVACSSTPQATPTATATIVPPNATSHPIGFATAPTPPSPTVRPTIELASRIEFYTKLLMGEIHACELPCIWGIEPGESDLDEFNAVFEPIRIRYVSPDDYEPTDSLTLSFEVDEDRQGTMAAQFVFKKEIIEYIHVQAASHPPGHYFYTEQLSTILRQYSMKTVLTEMGPPSKILIDNLRGGAGPGPSVFANVRLYYYDIGVLFEYIYNDGIKQGFDVITLCPEPDNMFWFTLVVSTPDNPSVLSGKVGDYKDLEDISNISIEEFTQLFATLNEPVCFETFTQ